MNYTYEIGDTSLGVRICEINSKNEVCFWSISTLKKKKLEFYGTYKQLKSLLRAQKWIQQNHPELLL
jgi:hypothetical protein